MEYSWQYTESMTQLVTPGREDNFRAFSTYGTLDKNNTHLRWITISKFRDGETFEIPSCILGLAASDTLRNKDRIIIPVVICSAGRRTSGAETMLKYFARQPFPCGLLKVVTPKGEVYYGCRGLILDSNFNPIFIATLQGYLQNNTITITKRIVHLSPSVFTDENAVLNKSLARKGVGFYLSTLLSAPPINHYRRQQYTYSDDALTSKVSIIIDDTSGWLNHPIKPKNPLNLSKDINSFIKRNIVDVLKQIQEDAC